MEPLSTLIEVSPDTARELRSIALNRGISVDDLLRVYVPELTSHRKQKDQVDRVNAFVEWASNHPTNTSLLSNEAVSRASFYED